MSIEVMNVAHHKREVDNYYANNPQGFGQNIYVLIHFLSPAIVFINGVAQVTGKDACIIYAPGQKQEYSHYKGVYVNNFLIYKTEDPYFTARYGLPQNEVFYVAGGDEITRLMEIITYTVTDKLVDRSGETGQHVLTLFETLSNSYIENKPGLKRMFEIKQRFIMLRDEIQKCPKQWSVDRMAKQVWFTRSHFTVLYNEFFGISPSVDLLSIKIEHAKMLLETGAMNVAEISVACGYKSVEHFIRIFNKYTKQTPLQYRKSKRK